ncbi:hypothetical protein D0962_35815 [Leptolyngbyaceae cyanobacterium CCMR0082]|uniref:NACHT domain-containing protein n=1 Tax=Adonisia turfae CCMR0082 TaxID=2304604 RepID=A0A6M0SHM2_9CYAN|nr:hypothetical protein [Adonisia turfae]NEZ68039.1 hypothetical protein [Adonisia turfae CCMR0082]
MLDGLDELGLTKQKQCIEKINQFLATTRTSEIVVCCRREEYEAGQIELTELNGAVNLETLKKGQICQYFEELNRLSIWENVKQSSDLLELAQKPLFLFMLIIAHQGDSIRNQQELFHAYIEKQLYEPRNQGTYQQGKEPTPERMTHYLVWLAKQLESTHDTEFLIEELQFTYLSSTEQIRLYEVMCGLIFALIGGLIGGLVGGLIGASVNKWLGMLLCSLYIGWRSWQTGRQEAFFVVELKEKLQWSFRQGLNGGLSGVVFFALLSIASGVVNHRLNIGLFVWLGGLFGATLTSGLTITPIEEKETPNQGIRRTIQNVLCVGLIGGLIGGLFSWLFFGPTSGLVIGLSFGLFLEQFFGDVAIKHLILRILLTHNGSTPWNYARFLDHAVKHRFIQRTGGRYRFVHDLLRKHFAAMPLE